MMFINVNTLGVLDGMRQGLLIDTNAKTVAGFCGGRGMIKSKLLEIRDAGTFIPIIAVELNGNDHYLLRQAGYGPHCYISIADLNKGKLSYNAHEWGDRTRTTAHIYIIEHWDSINEGDVIDVEFIKGETTEKKLSVQFENGGHYAL